MKILVVDDAAVNRRLLRILLERAGHVCAEAAGADEAAAAFAEDAADVAFVDLHMPGKDGVACANALRGLRGGGAAKIALVTGDDSEAAMATGLFDAAFAKPVAWAELEKFLAAAKR